LLNSKYDNILNKILANSINCRLLFKFNSRCGPVKCADELGCGTRGPVCQRRVINQPLCASRRKKRRWMTRCLRTVIRHKVCSSVRALSERSWELNERSAVGSEWSRAYTHVMLNDKRRLVVGDPALMMSGLSISQIPPDF